MIDSFQRIIRATDSGLARLYLGLFKERNALLTFLFHSLFRDESQIAQNLVDPLERTTVCQFRQLIKYYLEHDYQFISPQDLVDGIDEDGKYAMLTFDDGYYNNMLAVPVLQEFKIPAVFFISTNHVLQNRCFWWDVLHRERTAQGANYGDIYDEGVSLKSLRTEEIERRFLQRFGSDAFKPRGDIDRPFSPAELKTFASNPFVHIGNHTANHAILTNYSMEEMRSQIQDAQDSLEQMIGIKPCSIAYPNGAHNRLITTTCAELGLKVGFTIRPEKSALPLKGKSPDLFRVGRFVPKGDLPIERQCQTYRSDLQVYRKFRDGYLYFMRGKVGQ